MPMERAIKNKQSAGGQGLNLVLDSRNPMFQPSASFLKGGFMEQSHNWFLGVDVKSYRREPDFRLLILIIFILFILSILVGTARAESLLVLTAQHEIGRGEVGRDNYGADIKRYLQGEQGQSWCAGFVSYCIKKSGMKQPYIIRARNFLKLGKQVRNPQSGDLIVFWRGNPNGTTGHVGIVESVNGDTITTIEGNTGEFPSKVKRLTYNKNNIKRLIGFVRLGVSNV